MTTTTTPGSNVQKQKRVFLLPAKVLSSNVVVTFLLLIFSLLLPKLTTNRYYLHIVTVCFIYVIVASALNLVVGYIGYISFGHNALYGFGAYFSAVLVMRTGISFWLSIPLTVLACFLFGSALGYLTLSLASVKGTYFSLTTSALGMVTVTIFHNWVSVTRGPMGLIGIPVPGTILGINFARPTSYYYLALFCATLCVGILWRIKKSSFGRLLLSIKGDEDVARSVGIKIGYYKTVCFALSAAFTGFAGLLFAHYQRLLTPDMFSIYEAVDMVSMVIIGGTGTILGPIFGAFTVIALPEFLRPLALYKPIIFSVTVILILMFMPKGVVGTLENVVQEKIIRKNRGRDTE
jgi:branched-chain amino acid transport system permease protein